MRDLLQLGLGNALTAAALALAVWLTARCWRRPQAAWWLWALVLAKLAAPPLFSLPVRVDGQRQIGDSPAGGAAVAVESSQSLAEAYAATQGENSIAMPGEPSALSRGVEIGAPPTAAVEDSPALVLESLALAAWFAGSLLLASVVAVRVVRFHRLVRQTPCAGDALQRKADELSRRLGIRRAPQVRVIEARLAPLVWAVGRRAQVLLPAALLPRLNEEQTTALLAHELVHLRRRDPWMRWFETLTVVLHWWNPVAWWARCRLQDAEEECCDAAVLAALPGSAGAYAAALLETVDFLSEGPAAAPLLASGFGRVNLLKRRFEMILQGSRSPLSWRARAVLAIVAATVIPFSAYTVWGDEDASSLSVIERLERLERLVEKLLAREEAAESPKASVARETAPAVRQDVQKRLATLVEEFNQLIDQEKWDAAERVALQAREVAPDEEVVASMIWKAKFIKAYEARATRANDNNEDLSDAALLPTFGDETEWAQLTKNRRQWLQEHGRRLTPAEVKIHELLEKSVDVRFDNQPLSKVVETLAEATGVNVRLSEAGLAAEGASADLPVTIQLNKPVSLRSALNLILEPLHLSYVIRNEVLEITSEQVRRSDVNVRVYNVADLVVPIPNLVHGETATSEDLIVWMQRQHRELGAPPASDVERPSYAGKIPPTALQPDFDTLVETITSTIEPESWDERGGPGAITPHPGNLALVISQTGEVHEQIAELLEQMRRLLDVQIVIEARFLKVPDNFFESLGADFEVIAPVIRPVNYAYVGEDGLERIGVDFEVEANEKPAPEAIEISEAKHVVLSDSQARSLFKAVQNHRTASVIAAPKLMMINGQRAFVSFDLAANRDSKPGILSKLRKQRIAVVERESIALAVQGVAANDQKSVRLSVAPLFTRASQVIASSPLAAEKLPETQSAADAGMAVTVDVPVGSAVLLDCGGPAGPEEGRKSTRQRVLVLVTPRIVVAEEEEAKLGIELEPAAYRRK